VDYLSVLHEEKCRTGSDSGAGEQKRQKKCRTSSDIGAEQENHNVGQGPTLDRKGLIYTAKRQGHKELSFHNENPKG
jgi:hypothetical protein